MNLQKSIQAEINKTKLQNKCKWIFKNSLLENNILTYKESFINATFESKTVNELKKYIKVSENLKKILTK
jgi:hypothetical protein